MKIALPVNEKNMSSSICISFGRTPYFLIYDTDTLTPSFLDNGAIASQGGAGIKASQVLVDNGVNALITPRCGENAAAILKTANIPMYHSIEGSAESNVQAFISNTLSPLSNIHPGFHQHGRN